MLMKSPWLKRTLIFAPAVFLFVSLFGRFLWAAEGFAPGGSFFDFYVYFYPVADAAWNTVRAGQLPLWNPYIFSGCPSLAAIETQILYPPSLVHLFVPPARAFNLLLVFHVMLGAIGTWLYCRGRNRSAAGSVFAAMAVAAMGRLVLHIHGGHPTLVYSAFWWPIVLWQLDRCIRNSDVKNICRLAVVLACQFLAGYPMFTLVMAYLIPCYLLVFGIQPKQLLGSVNLRLVAACGCAALLALGLVSVQLLPTLELLGESQRSDLSYEWATSASFPPINLLTFLVPDFFGNDRSVAYWGETSVWESSAYCGVLTLFLSGLALFDWRNKETIFWAVLVVILIAVSMGRYTPLYDIFYRYVPGVSTFRGVGKLVVYAGFSICFLSAIGFDLVIKSAIRHRRRILAGCCTVVGLALLAGCWSGMNLTDTAFPSGWQSFSESVRHGRFTLLHRIPFPETSFFQSSWSVMNASLLKSSIVMMAAGGSILLSLRWRRLQAVIPCVLLSIAAIELHQFADRYLPVTDARPYRIPAERISALTSEDSEPWRFGCLSADPPMMNQFLYEGISCPDGNEDFILDRYSSFIELATGLRPQMQTYLVIPYVPVVYDMLNVKYFAVASRYRATELLSQDELFAQNAFRFNDVSFDVYRNPDVHPRVRIEHQPLIADSRSEATEMLAHTIANGNSHAVLEGHPGISLRSVDNFERAAETANVIKYSPTHIVIDVTLQQPGVLVVSENIYPGWEATVDDAPAEIRPANLFMRSVCVPAGRHRVEMTYRPASVRWGTILSLSTAALMALMLNVGRSRSPNSPTVATAAE